MSELSCCDCTSSGDYLAHLHGVARRELLMTSAIIEVTHRCNLRCTHCYLPSWESPGEWTTAELRAFLDKLADAGVLYLTFTGGEFFLRDDALEVLRYAREKRFSVAIITNGTLITREVARALADMAVSSVAVSIYGADEATYAKVTCKSGWYMRVAAALDHLCEFGVSTIMKMLITRDNVHQVEAVQAWAESLDCDFQQNYEVTPQDHGGTRSLAVAMTDEQFVAYLAKHKRPTKDRGLKDPESRTCQVGYKGLAYSPTGDVYPCIQMKRPIGNVRQQDLVALWRGSPELGRLRNMKFSDFPVCSTCEHSSYCGVCAGLSVIENDGDPFGPNTTGCRTAAAMVAAGVVEGKSSRPLKELLRELPRYGEALVVS